MTCKVQSVVYKHTDRQDDLKSSAFNLRTLTKATPFGLAIIAVR